MAKTKQLKEARSKELIEHDKDCGLCNPEGNSEEKILEKPEIEEGGTKVSFMTDEGTKDALINEQRKDITEHKDKIKALAKQLIPEEKLSELAEKYKSLMEKKDSMSETALKISSLLGYPINNMAFDSQEFLEAVKKANKGSIIIFDETGNEKPLEMALSKPVQEISDPNPTNNTPENSQVPSKKREEEKEMVKEIPAFPNFSGDIILQEEMKIKPKGKKTRCPKCNSNLIFKHKVIDNEQGRFFLQILICTKSKKGWKFWIKPTCDYREENMIRAD